MLKYYIKTSEALLRTREAFQRLLKDKDGVVSFEYIVVACMIVLVVGAAFAKTGPLYTAMTNGFTTISTNLATATGA